MKLKLFLTSILSLLMVCLSYSQSTDKLNTAINTVNNKEHREMVRATISRGINNSIDENSNFNPLLCAIVSTDLKVVSCLIELGADVNAITGRSQTPLSVARFCKKDDIVALLIKSGAEELEKEVVAQTESDEDSLLIEQILKKRLGQTSIDEISKLLEGGLDTEDRYGRTPLTLAVECRYYDLVRALIEAGVDVNLNQPLITAVGSNDSSIPDEELILLLIDSGSDVNQTDKHSMKTPLMQAIYFDAADIVEILISYGADLNKKDDKGQTALSIAKHRQNERIVDILLAKEADDAFTPIEHISPTLNTLLNSERSKKMSKVYNMLSEGINSRDEEGRTVLIYAISNEDDFFGFPEDIFAELVKIEGIEINAQDNEGFTALMHAAGRQKTSYTQMLLDAGAKVNMTDLDKRTALFFAVSTNKVEVARLLIANGAKVNEGNNSWTTPIMQVESPEMLKMLLDNGADVNAHNSGMTLLMKQLWNPRVDLVEVLLERKVNVNATDNKGMTALDYAEYRLSSSDKDNQTAEVQEIMNMLIKAGAKKGKLRK